MLLKRDSIRLNADLDRLRLAGLFAKNVSGCRKVAVGSVIFKNGMLVAMGANRAIPNLCKTDWGCLRVEKYGENSKLHRNPEDCRAIHSEIDAIANRDEGLDGATIYITRYPCEACARAIVAAGITRVVYGREQVISEQTAEILAGLEVVHVPAYREADVMT